MTADDLAAPEPGTTTGAPGSADAPDGSPEREGNGCLFCAVPDREILRRTALFIVRADQYPATPGHVLIIPDWHIGSFFELTASQHVELFAALRVARQVIEDLAAAGRWERPDGYNLGINDGAPAGRTVHHLHVHLIPRRRGDVADPRGGIRRGLPNGDPNAWLAPRAAAAVAAAAVDAAVDAAGGGVGGDSDPLSKEEHL